MTKAIIFDLGNVVLTSDHPYHTPDEIRQFCDYYDVTLDNLALAFNVAFRDYEVGKCSEIDFWKNYLCTARASTMDIFYAKAFWRKNQKENEHMLSLLRQLGKSCRLAALANIPKEWLEFKQKTFRLDDYFEVIVSSGEYGVKKPESKIYQIALKKLAIKPENIIYIDDWDLNLLPAEKLGIQTILFRGQENLTRQLHKLAI